MKGTSYQSTHLCFFLYFILLLTAGELRAQTGGQTEKTYEAVIKQRAGKIVEALKISNTDKASKLTEIISDQYLALNDLQAKRDTLLKQIKPGAADSEKKTKEIKDKTDQKIAKLHKQYVAKLSSQLSPAQVEQVKDGMTYNVVPLTYANYLLMLPYLNQEQKSKIRSSLTEAREFAIDGGSSKEKHAWFGKYKGKITNYLTTQGYDLKKESSDWAIRRNLKSSALEIVESNRVMQSLAVENAATKESVRNLLAHQYQQVQKIQNERDQKMKAASEAAVSKEAGEKDASAVWANYQTKLNDQRNLFVQTLSGFIGNDQVELAKNTMTDNGLNKEYNHFQALLPNLTEAQKKQVYQYLLEARDNSMNALKPKEREKWFIKYRGRANNYLAKQGYNLRKATEELEAKLVSDKSSQAQPKK